MVPKINRAPRKKIEKYSGREFYGVCMTVEWSLFLDRALSNGANFRDASCRLTGLTLYFL
jgi:hypothetical protein